MPAPMWTTPMRKAMTDHRIGPNAILQMQAVLQCVEGDLVCRGIFAQAGLEHYLDCPPRAMVPECDAARLHMAMHRKLGDARARTLGWLAGRLTALYLLDHRIPKAAQFMLRLLPARLGALLLCALISRHAWTFTGSGRMRITQGRPIRIVITGSPLVMGANSPEPWCDYFTGTFETLFAKLISSRTHVVETACIANGDAACCFEVRLAGAARVRRAAQLATA